MPIEYERIKTPSRHTILRTLSLGFVSPEDANEYIRQTSPGGTHHGLALLGVMAKDVEMSPEARKVFTLTNPAMQDTPTAIVVPSAALRVMVNFMLRVGNNGAHIKLFPTEEAAVGWLDEQLSAR